MLVACPGASPQDTAQAQALPYTLPGTRIHTLDSTHVGDRFHISVALPLAYASAPAERTFPVVFVPDADIGFAMATQVSRLMEIRQEIPAFIIVGIGYGGLRPGLARRVRDLTPSVMSEHDPCTTGPFPCGGAVSFLAFIEGELKPFVAEHYRADVDDNAYFGYSLGGLFGLYVLFEKPGAFKRYAIASPSLWWGDGEPMAFEAAYAGAHDDLRVKVFLSVGSLDRPDMVAETVALAGRLGERGYPGLDLSYQVFPDETHASAPAASFSRAMRVLFD
jgi:predicted alpha/beta superfamily hydrolase